MSEPRPAVDPNEQLDIDKVLEIADQIRPFLRGYTPLTQGAVISEIVATFAAGFIDEAGPKATKRLREKILRQLFRTASKNADMAHQLYVEPQLHKERH